MPVSEPKEGDLVVSETATSTWHYHLRRIGPEGPKYGGGAGKALCGANLGWDTRIPVRHYGQKSEHIPEHYCAECAALAGITLPR
jgi:hypothetical protein